VKRDNEQRSRTATPFRQGILGSRLVRALWVPSLTGITLPLARLTLGGHLWMILLLGLLPLVPYLLVAVTFVAVYLRATTRALRITTGRGESQLANMGFLFTYITNAPIAFLTMRWLPEATIHHAKESVPTRRPRRPGRFDRARDPDKPLAVGSPPLWWETVQAHFANGGGQPDVKSTVTADRPYVGRHAAPGTTIEAMPSDEGHVEKQAVNAP
jgi:hypothetical protein